MTFSACQNSHSSLLSRNKKSARTSAPSGKFKNPTFFSRINPFQGRAKSRLAKSKRKKFKLFKRKRSQRGRNRKGKRPGKQFDMKRKVSRGRLNSSGSRVKSGGSGKKKKNKDLFNTRKK